MNGEVEAMMRAMYGQHARHAAFNYVVQGCREKNDAAIIGNTVFAMDMSFGGVAQGIHTLVLCDVVIRPHLVIASNHLQGCGAAGILTSDALASPTEWIEKGTVILNNIPRSGGGRR